ncbi:hypothetical protein pipiens_008689 [Culex pipiens pipiens]|uniref:Fibrinogen C-terminal domain-containing protein n=1 Tax=Culex pipiens pipiens TaxID=38569 RepID=A0ABD1DGF5_CULPP
MLSPGLLITLASLCGGAVLVSEEDGKQIQLQEAAAFGYEILEHRLDNLQNTFFKLFTSMEKVEQTRLEGQRAMLEQIQKGITVQTVNRGAHRIIEDCMQADVSGRYLLRPVGSSKTFAVVCEAESLGGGWIVIQQRINGTVEFNRNWEDYNEGIIGNAMEISFNEQFSANDKDYDKETDIHCGSKYKGGWWFFDCDRANLNGPYKKDPQTGRGIYWKKWADAATYSRIMIRRC